MQLSVTVKTKGKVSVKCSRDLACCQAGQQSPAASGFTTDAVDNALCSDIQ